MILSKTDRRFKAVDALLIIMMIVPILIGITLKVLFTPASEGVSINGALIYFKIPMPIQDFPITEAQVNSVLVIMIIFFLCLYMTHGLKERPELKRQHFAEMIVEATEKLVRGNMGEYFMGFAPFIASIMAISAFSSLMSLFGLYPATSDINIVGGWAILVFGIITYYKLKCGPVNYLKGFAEPVAVFAPINFISEFATPVSMAFRHYGNVLSGIVVSALLGTALQGLSARVFSFARSISWLEWLADAPLLQAGIPGVLSLYFDVFSGLLQAFIFATLTMLYVSGAFNIELFKERRKNKENKKAEKAQKNKN
jgi:F-type H+-transporting ATPase subunit a